MSKSVETRIGLDAMSGGVTNLLRTARSGCDSAVAFVAFRLGGEAFVTVTFPETSGDGSLGPDVVDEVVRRLWLDPALGATKTLVRFVPVEADGPAGETRVATAAIPLAEAGGSPWGVFGVAEPGARVFGPPELELLAHVAQRLASYARARSAVWRDIDGEAPTGTQAAAGRPGRGPVGGSGAGAGAAGADAAEPAGTEPAVVGPDTAGPWWAVRPCQDPGPPAGPGGSGGPGSGGPGSGGRGGGGPGGGGPGGGGPGGIAGEAGAPSAAREPAAFRDAAAREPGEAGASVPGAGAAGRAPAIAPAAPRAAEGTDLLFTEDAATGVLSLGALLGRFGRLLGAGAVAGGTLAVVAVDVGATAEQADDVVRRGARALSAELRFDDLVGRVSGTVLAAVVPLVPGGSAPGAVEEHLAAAVAAAVPWHAESVRSARLLVDVRTEQEPGELLRVALARLGAR